MFPTFVQAVCKSGDTFSPEGDNVVVGHGLPGGKQGSRLAYADKTAQIPP